MKPARIALFAPPSPFYGHLLTSLGSALRSLGHHCIWQLGSPTHDIMAEWAKSQNLNLVLDINRVLPSDQAWPDGIAHACWLQDYRYDGADLTSDIGKSDHIYFLISPHSFGMQIPSDRRWSFLLPAARTDVPRAKEASYRCDFSLCGFIPKPIVDSVVGQAPDGTDVSLLQLVGALPPGTVSQSQFVLGDIHRAIDEACDRRGWTLIDKARMFVDEMVVRTIDRVHVVTELLQVSDKFEIWGPQTWLRWPAFAPLYRGELQPLYLDSIVYQVSRINVHNGRLTMHFRVIDCMAAGTFVFVNRTPFDTQPGGIGTFFEADVHYGSYRLEDVAPVARDYLQNEKARLKIAEEGRRAVLAAHTWQHRAAQIVQDFDL